MKSILYIIINLLFLLSCKNNKVEKTEKKEVILSEKSSAKKDVPIFKSPKNCGDTAFDAFFERFSKDSVFQKQRVKYPLKWVYYDDLESNTPTIEMTDYQSYRFFNFVGDKEASKKEYGAFSVGKLQSNDTIIYQRKGLDNGLLIKFKFKLIDDCWFMVEILDESS